MKKSLTKLSALILAASSLITISGCSDKTEESKVAVTGFMDAICQLDFKSASSYVDSEDFLADIPFENLDGAKDLFMKELGDEVAAYSDTFTPVADTLLGKITGSMSYEITSSEKTEDGYLHKITLNSIDFDQVGEMDFLSELDFEALGTELINELLTNGTISLTSSEEEVMPALMTGLRDKLLPIIEEGLDAMGTTTSELELLVAETDGTWKIVNEKSTFENFDGLF